MPNCQSSSSDGTQFPPKMSHNHQVLFYEDNAFPDTTIGDFLYQGLVQGDAVIIIATAANAAAIKKRFLSLGVDLEASADWGRHGQVGPRGDGRIGFSVIRGGDIVGEHTALFAMAGERLEITHKATDRMIFARGAVRAAAWLDGRAAGMYALEDLLN